MKKPCRLVSFLIIMLISSTFLKPVSASTTFNDIERVQSWAGDSIEYFVHKGVIHGIGNNKFDPMGELTRGEAAKILALNLSLDVNLNKKTNFIDAKNHWSSPYIHALQTEKEGIINGFPDGTFKPNGLITREQMAKLLATAYTFKENEEIDFSLRFNDVSGWAMDYIHILASHGIIYGKTQNAFAPKDPVTRAEATVLFHRAEMVYLMIPPEFFDENITVVQDGVEFEIMLKQSNALLYVWVQATNISEENIPYIGTDGCDTGITINLFKNMERNGVQVGGKSTKFMSCPQVILQHNLAPGETIENMEVLFPPTGGFKESHYVKVGLRNGLINDMNYSYSPIELGIPLKQE